MMNDILCYGDSNTYGYDPRDFWGEPYPDNWVRLTAQQTGLHLINRGRPGRQLPTAEAEYEYLRSEIRREHPDLVLVMLGTNDVLNLMHPSAEILKGRLDRLIRFLKDDCGVTQLCIIAPPGLADGSDARAEDMLQYSGLRLTSGEIEAKAAEFAAFSKQFGACFSDAAKRYGCDFLDAGDWMIPLAYDGVHFSSEGHRIFAGHIVKYLQGKQMS